jgi:hypothetical protein
MSTTSELISVADRQIARLKLLTHQQALHVESLEHGHHNAEAKRARVTLDLMLSELSILERFRLSLCQVATFTDEPVGRAS